MRPSQVKISYCLELPKAREVKGDIALEGTRWQTGLETLENIHTFRETMLTGAHPSLVALLLAHTWESWSGFRFLLAPLVCAQFEEASVESIYDGFSSSPKKHFSCRWCCSIYSSWCLPVDTPAPPRFPHLFPLKYDFLLFSEIFPLCFLFSVLWAFPFLFVSCHDPSSSLLLWSRSLSSQQLEGCLLSYCTRTANSSSTMVSQAFPPNRFVAHSSTFHVNTTLSQKIVQPVLSFEMCWLDLDIRPFLGAHPIATRCLIIWWSSYTNFWKWEGLRF